MSFSVKVLNSIGSLYNCVVIFSRKFDESISESIKYT